MDTTTSWILTVTTDYPYSDSVKGVHMGQRLLGELVQRDGRWTAMGMTHVTHAATHPLGDDRESWMLALVDFYEEAEDLASIEAAYLASCQAISRF